MSYISKSSQIKLNGYVWKVNSRPSGIYTHMAKSMISQPIAMLSYHSRVLGVRLDFHIYSFVLTNTVMTTFQRRFSKWLKRKYRLKRVAYSWAREQETGACPHYHYVFYVDGHKVRYPSKLIARAKETWELMGGFCYVPENCYYLLIRGDLKLLQSLVWRISYLAKARGKGHRPPQTKDYSCSRLKLNEKRCWI